MVVQLLLLLLFLPRLLVLRLFPVACKMGWNDMARKQRAEPEYVGDATTLR